MTHKLLQAAIQMDRDGIRTIHRKRRPLCGHVHNPGDPIVIRCHKRAGYSTPLGNRCFTHAIEQASSRPGQRHAPAQIERKDAK